MNFKKEIFTLINRLSKSARRIRTALSGMDPVLVISVMMLSSIGLIFIFNSSSVLAQAKFDDQYFFLKKQLWAALLGGILMIGVSVIPYQLYKKMVPLLLVLSMGLLGVIFLPGVGVSANGAVRWLRLPVGSIQVAEPVKICLILYVACFLSKRMDRRKNEKPKSILPVSIIIGLIISMILLQPDFGTAMTIGLVCFSMLFAFGIQFRYVLLSMASLLPVVYFLVFSVDYRRRRFLSFIDPWQDPMDSGFQIIQSYVAFFNGKMTGLGLGQGKQALFFLPEIHTDFIFSVIGEELGFLGCILVMFIFMLMITRLFSILLSLSDPFAQFVVFGLSGLLTIQTLFNLGVVTGLLPTKGLPLPFISYGRSALITNLVAMGIILNIARSIRMVRGPKGV